MAHNDRSPLYALKVYVLISHRYAGEFSYFIGICSPRPDG